MFLETTHAAALIEKTSIKVTMIHLILAFSNVISWIQNLFLVFILFHIVAIFNKLTNYCDPMWVKICNLKNQDLAITYFVLFIHEQEDLHDLDELILRFLRKVVFAD